MTPQRAPIRRHSAAARDAGGTSRRRHSDANRSRQLALSGHNAHAKTCGWLELVAIHPKRNNASSQSTCGCATPVLNEKGHLMAWVYIVLADVFEVAWPFVLKRSVELPKWTTALSAVVFALPIFLLLSEPLRRLPASTVYASFAGIATLGTAIVGILFFRESATPGRLGFIMLVVIGLVGLKLSSE
jgi:quaternary ammonium compound-resistance protein SugE